MPLSKNPRLLTFGIYRCGVEFSQYSDNDRVAIRLIGAPGTEFEGEPIATATVNIPQYDLPDDHVLIKSWSENQGMLKALYDAGIVSLPIQAIPCGFEHAAECKLLVDPNE